VPNYDGRIMEPTLLPTNFPNVLVSANQGIAVGMASNICGFNLEEVCDAAIARIRNPQCDLLEIMKGPDFPTGGQLLYDRAALEEVYRTGRGSLKVRGKWRYDKKENVVEIYEIPYSTTVEAIMDKVAELVKAGKIKEISDMRDETDLSGLKLAIDLKRGVDPEKLMAKLCKSTPLQDNFACNFNILIEGTPHVLGVGQILDEWTAWRTGSVRRRAAYEMQKKQEKLHLLKGLKRILLDIDKAIRIIRETEADAEVVPNLMIGFGIDQIQAEYVADIKLRNINKEFILKRTAEVDQLEDEIADLQDLIDHPKRLQKVIISELTEVKKKYAQPRRTEILYDYTEEGGEELEAVPSYPVNLFLSKEGYLKKITPLSLRMSGEQKYKEGDGPWMQWECQSSDEIMVFTNQQNVYKARLDQFADSKASLLGDYLPTKLAMDKDESVVWVCLPGDYSGTLLFFYENGKAGRVELAKYQTQTNRKRLTGAYSDKSPLRAAFLLREDTELAVYSTEGRCLIFNTSALAPKSTRSTQGVAVLTLKKERFTLDTVRPVEQTPIVNKARYRTRAIPAVGALLKPEDRGEEQLKL
jgi:DNA gyrase subunit A